MAGVMVVTEMGIEAVATIEDVTGANAHHDALEMKIKKQPTGVVFMREGKRSTDLQLKEDNIMWTSFPGRGITRRWNP
jgi:hypothetical protein